MNSLFVVIVCTKYAVASLPHAEAEFINSKPLTKEINFIFSINMKILNWFAKKQLRVQIGIIGYSLTQIAWITTSSIINIQKKQQCSQHRTL